MIFQGILTSIAKKPYIFVIVQGGPDLRSPSGSTHVFAGRYHSWSGPFIPKNKEEHRGHSENIGLHVNLFDVHV